MAAGMLMKIACVVVACMVVVAPYAEAAISCGQVVSDLSSCLGYLKAGGPVPPPCCKGVRQLFNAANTTPDRQATCVCLKNAYNSMPDISISNSASLPNKCGVNIPYKIAPSTDCSKVV